MDFGGLAAFAVEENADVRVGMRSRRGLTEQVEMGREKNRSVAGRGEHGAEFVGIPRRQERAERLEAKIHAAFLRPLLATGASFHDSLAPKEIPRPFQRIAVNRIALLHR